MSILGKIKNIVIAFLLLVAGIIMIGLEEEGFFIVVLIFGISLLAAGIRKLHYYFTMARHMVGGRLQLYLGVVILDLGILTLSLYNVPAIYLHLYEFAMYAFAGGISILRAMEVKRVGATNYKFELINGIVHVIVALLCVIFLNSHLVTVYIFAAGLIYSAIARVITTFKRQESVVLNP